MIGLPCKRSATYLSRWSPEVNETMTDLTVKSTSRISAECSDYVLRETATTRLVFRPLLVQNEKAPNASVKGSFIFQRKGLCRGLVGHPYKATF